MRKGFQNAFRTRSRRHSISLGSACVLRVESLEQRHLLSGISIQFDYTYDTNNFFNTQAKKDLLDQAASVFEDRINDTLLAIKPSGSNTWSAVFTDPSSGQNRSIDNLNIAEGMIIVYVGGRTFSSSSELGEGGPGGFNANGNQTWLDTVSARGQSGALASPKTDFGTWGGSITFATNATWHFGSTTSGLGSGETDFLSVATHELGHLLGFGTAASFQNLVSNSQFTGSRSVAAFGSPVPVQPDPGGQTFGHWATSVQSGGQQAAMTPSIAAGIRKNFTTLDFAGLQDMGWTYSTGPVLMYRTYNPQADVHFYTFSQAEFQFVTTHGYNDETTGSSSFSVADDRPPGALPLHRLYNPNDGLHYYTTSDGERDFLVTAGWVFEKEEGNVFGTQVTGTTEIFRMYNVNTGEHLYIPSDSERAAILAAFPGIWVQHSSLGFAYPSGTTPTSVAAQLQSLAADAGELASLGTAPAATSSEPATVPVHVAGLTSAEVNSGPLSALMNVSGNPSNTATAMSASGTTQSAAASNSRSDNSSGLLVADLDSVFATGAFVAG